MPSECDLCIGQLAPEPVDETRLESRFDVLHDHDSGAFQVLPDAAQGLAHRNRAAGGGADRDDTASQGTIVDLGQPGRGPSDDLAAAEVAHQVRQVSSQVLPTFRPVGLRQ